MKTIKVTINEDGTAVIEGQGFSGPECEKATREIEAALGITTSSKKKPEFFSTTNKSTCSVRST